MLTVSILMFLVAVAGCAKILFGFPIIGGVLPRIWRRHLALNRDGSFVDTGESLIEDEVGYYYVEPVTLEWLGVGLPLTKAVVRITETGEPAEHDFEVIGG